VVDNVRNHRIMLSRDHASTLKETPDSVNAIDARPSTTRLRALRSG
jgi:hypothetical protein